MEDKETEFIDLMIAKLKSLKSSIKKKNKLSDNLGSAGLNTYTPRRLGNMTADLNWECMNIDKETTGFARAFKGSDLDVCTGEKEYNPSGFHSYKG
jgi:hypothetical protein